MLPGRLGEGDGRQLAVRHAAVAGHPKASEDLLGASPDINAHYVGHYVRSAHIQCVCHT